MNRTELIQVRCRKFRWGRPTRTEFRLPPTPQIQREQRQTDMPTIKQVEEHLRQELERIQEKE